MRMLFVYAIVGISLYFVLSEMLKFSSAISGGKRQRAKDLLRFQERLTQFSPVEWQWKELDLLSQKIELNQSTRIFNSLLEGSYNSIYEESIGHFIAKKYGKGFALLIKTYKWLYTLEIDDRGKGTLRINDSDLLNCTVEKNTFALNSEHQEAALDLSKNIGLVFIGGKKILELAEEGNDEYMSRAVSHISEIDTTQPNDQMLVTFLLLFSLIWPEFYPSTPSTA